MNIGKTGKSGEDKVAAFLQAKGYTVLKQNYQCRFGEIDIIAENDEYIIFVEVKTRRDNSLVSGAEAVDYKKRQRIMLTAQDYLSKCQTELQPRFDVAEVRVKQTDIGSRYYLNYIKNAF